MTEEELINQHMGLVKFLAFRAKPKNPTMRDEYIQCGMIGLLKAIRKHDPSRGQLTTIAWYYIHMEITRFKQKEYKFYSKHVHLVKDRAYNNTEKVQELLPTLSDKESRIIDYKLSGLKWSEIAEKEKADKRILQRVFKLALEKIKKANEKNPLLR